MTHFINLLSMLLGPGKYSARLRALLLNLLGNSISYRARIAGGGYIYGRGLTVGHRCFLGRSIYIDLSRQVTIEEDAVIGHHTVIVTADHEIGPATRRCGAVRAAPVVIGKGAWIGARATILPGVSVGAGAVVAAGSLVRSDVAPNTLVAGVPARLVRELEPASSA